MEEAAEAPAVGTRVRKLFDDGEWYGPADVARHILLCFLPFNSRRHKGSKGIC
jgi:hypothetical protein